MNDPVLSILIPCYNSGKYLPEALESITSYHDKNFYEIIIINDGSTDSTTITLLNDLHKQGYHIINQDNKGPGAARNKAAEQAKGKYLLLLDSDNKVRHNYINKGIKILDEMPDISIVHGRPFFFGDDIPERRFETGSFDVSKILVSNYIDTCSIIRKIAWQQLGGQDESRLIMGHADWEFWVRAGAGKHKFFFIDEVCFDYRIVSNSLVTKSLDNDSWQREKEYIYIKHIQTIVQQYSHLYVQYLIYQRDQQQPIRSFIKFFFNKYFKSKRD